MSLYLIHDLAKETQLSHDTIRFYEKKQLIQPSFRANNHYRYYNDDVVKRLIFIKHCRALDMSLADIQRLLEFSQYPENSCQDVNVFIEKHIEKIQKKIAELRSFEQQLHDLRASCSSNHRIDDCQILKQLEEKNCNI